jgi:hypothetical protein
MLVERLDRHNRVVVAHGTVDGQAAGAFVRSLVTDTISAECEDGWDLWRWYVRQHKGRRQVNKVNIYRA